MKKITVNSISRHYERLYKKFSEYSSADETFFSINNAMIFSYFLRLEKINYNGNNFFECCNKIEQKYGYNLFFYNVKKTSKYKENLEESIEVFSVLFQDSVENDTHLEQLLGHVLEKHINQKDTGSYYTPSDTTNYIAWNSIVSVLINKLSDNIKIKVLNKLECNDASEIIKNSISKKVILSAFSEIFSKKEIQEVIETIYDLRIVDPTCGSGAFIVTAFECIETLLLNLSHKVDYEKVLRCLYGVDISAEAIQLTKLRLIMTIARKEQCFIDFNEIFKANFIVADSLKGSDYKFEENGFDWKQFGLPFDCVIGNPPYVEMRNYVSDNYQTKSCGNLYAYTIERACNIVAQGGMVSFIVPLSLVSTPRMQKVKQYIESISKQVLYSTFADRPGCIFTGVHQRLTIFFAQIENCDKVEVFSSSYKYWYNDERDDLYKKIKYHKNEYDGILPKIGNEIEETIYHKLVNGKNNISDILTNKIENNNPVYLSTRIGFWTKAFLSNVFSSKEYKIYYAKSNEYKYLLTAILNSSTFYFLWVLISDCWHITAKNLMSLTFNLDNLSKEMITETKRICDVLMEDLEKNKKYIGSKQTEYEYKHKYSKEIIDEIDDLLAPLFSLDEKEVSYIKEFTKKYRTNNLEA